MIYTPKMDCIKNLEVSKDHLAFLAEWLEWAEATPSGSAEPHDSFWAGYRLCSNYDSWCVENGVRNCNFVHFSEEYYGKFTNSYPFGKEVYELDQADNSQHKNPTRLSWVKAVLECYTPKVHLDSVITVEVVECGSMPPADSGTLL